MIKLVLLASASLILSVAALFSHPPSTAEILLAYQPNSGVGFMSAATQLILALTAALGGIVSAAGTIWQLWVSYQDRKTRLAIQQTVEAVSIKQDTIARVTQSAAAQVRSVAIDAKIAATEAKSAITQVQETVNKIK